MKKLLFVFSIVVLLSAGCNSSQQAVSQTQIPEAQKPAAQIPKPTTTPPILNKVKQPVPSATVVPAPVAKDPLPHPAVSAGPQIAGCPVFPADNPWNKNISQDPVDPNSDSYINSIGKTGHLHADFGGNGAYGIPFIVVNAGQAKVPINFTAYGDESDPGPYPIPPSAPVEGGNASTGDRHVLVVDSSSCKLYELANAFYKGPGWDASVGAVFNLRSNALRPEHWTSADAAGLPIFAGLARYEEVAAGSINHALRFTVSRSQKAYIHPATHFASASADPSLPPMGLRLRLKADYDISKFTGQSKIILQALKTYGMIVADNGGSWFITGDGDQHWNDNDLNQLKTVPGSAFEAVKSGNIIK